MLFENVKNLVGKKFKGDFNNLLEVLDELGYNTYWKIINGKNCGIPQKRERVFAICIRKDIDRHSYTFPKPFDTGIRLKDLLDNEVDEKYYINNSRADELIINLLERENILETSPGELCLKEPKLLDIANCLTAKDSGIANRASTGTGVIDVKKSNKVMQVGGLTLSDKRMNPSANRVYLAKGISPTLVTSSGG